MSQEPNVNPAATEETPEEKTQEAAATEPQSPETPTESESASDNGAGEEEIDFQAIFDAGVRTLKRGDVIEGRVVEILKDHLLMDIKFKSEGIVAIDEFRRRGIDTDQIKEGDVFDVYVDQVENEEGLIVLSKEKADQMKVWDTLSESHKEGEPVKGRIVSRVKGGLTVDLGGVYAFLPGSQVDFVPIRDLERFEGEEYDFKIIKFDRRTGNVVLSRKILLEKEREALRTETLANLEEGMLIQGVVKNITDYGVFLDLGGVDGLLHITDISWGRISHPSEVFNTGDEVTVKVLKFDRERNRVSLGLKQTKPDPWEDAENKFAINSRVTGKVVNLVDYGAFVELEEGIEGLIHVSEMSWTQKIRNPAQVVSVGDEVEVVVLDINPDARRISLGLKQTQENPWDTILDRYPIGSTVEGTVKNFADFGMFVGLEEGIDGLVHVSDMSWTKRVKNPSKLFKKGDKIEVKVLNIDPDNERFSLGIKQLEEDPWREIPNRYRVGDRVKGKIVNVTDFGLFVEIEPDLEGLVHVSELPKERFQELKKNAADQPEVDTEIINIDPVERKIGLSVTALETHQEQDDLAAAPRSAEGGTAPVQHREPERATMGDLLKNLPGMDGMMEKKEEPAEEKQAEEAPAQKEDKEQEAQAAEEPKEEPKAEEAPAEEPKEEPKAEEAPAEEPKEEPKAEESAGAESAEADGSEDEKSEEEEEQK